MLLSSPTLTPPLPWSQLFLAPGSKPHFETIAAMLDTTRAVPTCVRHNPFEFDDCGISNALYNAIARAHRFEHPTFMNWLDPVFLLSLVQTPADPVLCTQLDAERIELPSVVSTSQRARCARPHRFPSQRHFDVVQPLLTDDLVFEHPSRTCSAQMRIRISSRSPSGVYTDVVPSRPAHSHPSVAPVALSRLAGASCTTCTVTTSTAARPRRPYAPAPNTMRPVTAKPHHAYHVHALKAGMCDTQRPMCPIAYTALLASRPRRPSPAQPHSRAAPTTICTTTRVRSARSGCSSSPALRPSSARAVRPLIRRPSTSQLYHRCRSTPTHPTPCLRTLGPTHSTTGMRPRLKQQEAIVAHPRRDAATRTSAVPHLPPPFVRLISPRLAEAWRAPSASRRLSQGGTRCTLRAMYCATTTSPHALYDFRDAVPRRYTGARRRRAAAARAAATLWPGIQIPLCSLLERAAPPAAFRERRPTASARARGAKICEISINLYFEQPFFAQEIPGDNSIIFNETGQDEIQHFPTDFLGTRKRHREAWKQLNCD
ncbi:hypothetical protein B0H13DRAFT_1888022 [Mycena leptocephala]|nr:hypothetical protein B0H13DRAFT_1888022 [Mycena leptocephala]